MALGSRPAICKSSIIAVGDCGPRPVSVPSIELLFADSGRITSDPDLMSR